MDKINPYVYRILSETKPMENYYTCRLKEPVDGAKYRYEKDAARHKGKRIDHVYMIPPGKKSVLQALRFPKKEWEESSAKSYCSSRNGRFNV